MLELFRQIEWSDYTEVLTYGNPPIYVQLLFLVGLTIAIVLYRTISRKRELSKGNKVKYKFLFFAVAGLILFQEKFDLRGLMDTIGF